MDQRPREGLFPAAPGDSPYRVVLLAEDPELLPQGVYRVLPRRHDAPDAISPRVPGGYSADVGWLPGRRADPAGRSLHRPGRTGDFALPPGREVDLDRNRGHREGR